MNFYPFHPGDYMLRTAHLDPLEDLAYRRLLDLYYVNEGPITGGAQDIARVIRMRANAAEVEVVLREFFTETEAGWQHSHCEEVIAQYQAKARQAAENGKLGGRPRKQAPSQQKPYPSPTETKAESKNNPAETQPVISANQEKTVSKTNQEPITNNHNQEDQKPCAPSAHDDDACGMFAKFWRLYPRKTDKAKAQKAWAKLDPGQPLFDEIMQGLAKHCASRDWTKDDGQFIPHPTTWLKGRRWEDEMKPAGTVHTFPGQSRHAGFAERDYTAGLYEREDGTYGF